VVNAKVKKPPVNGQSPLKMVAKASIPVESRTQEKTQGSTAEGQTGVLDPQTGKIQWRDMTPQEVQDARKRVSGEYEEDFTPKGLREALLKRGAEARARK
jgi:hypothetical protein